VQVLGEIGRGIHHLLVLRRGRGRIVRALGLPVEVAQCLLAAGIGHDDEVPALRVASRRRLESQVEALLQQFVFDRAGQVESLEYGPRRRQQLIGSEIQARARHARPHRRPRRHYSGRITATGCLATASCARKASENPGRPVPLALTRVTSPSAGKAVPGRRPPVAGKQAGNTRRVAGQSGRGGLSDPGICPGGVVPPLRPRVSHGQQPGRALRGREPGGWSWVPRCAVTPRPAGTRGIGPDPGVSQRLAGNLTRSAQRQAG
jgi:hypothetical protein